MIKAVVKGILGGGCVLGLLSCSGTAPSLKTAKNFRPDDYAGTWHEIARLPNFFQRDTVAAQAVYGKLEGGEGLSVWNRGIKVSGEEVEIKGKAVPTDERTPTEEAKLKVRFSRFPASLFAGDYWILSVNEPHTRAVVGTPSRKMLWLLSKDASDEVEDFKVELGQAKKDGFPIEKLLVSPKRFPVSPE